MREFVLDQRMIENREIRKTRIVVRAQGGRVDLAGGHDRVGSVGFGAKREIDENSDENSNENPG
jgi:hypothetical protein